MPSYYVNNEVSSEVLFDQTVDLFKNRPGFFTPYKGFSDVGISLVTPIALPVVSGLCLTAAGVLTTISLASLAAAYFAELKGDRELGTKAWLISGVTAGLAGIAIMATVAFALSIPFEALRICTRTIATLLAPLFNCCSGQENVQHELLPSFAHV